jgi:saccharopine dehydrogenase (NAD+, L-lysine forming)
MSHIKLGIIREGKVPPDKRVPLTPKQCKQVEQLFPQVKVVVQTSPVRAFTDKQYTDEGVEIVSDLSDCDIIMGVKEVNISDLIPNKKFLFFSHTIKKQPYNRDLLRAILDKNIQLIDYEVLKNSDNKRIIGFGRYAGIVGAYNGFRTFGLKNRLYDLKQACACADRIEMENELKKVILPADTRIVLTGFGRVGNGAREIMKLVPITEVKPAAFLAQQFDYPVFTHLEVNDYFERMDGVPFDKKTFYEAPELFQSAFQAYAEHANMYIACHYWSNKSPFILTNEHLKTSKLTVVADISCDIAGPIACTIRPSKIADPIFGYSIATGEEADWINEGVVAVMAVDNLPCELPLDASEDFGNELIAQVFPALFGEDPTGIIERGSETDLFGKLTPNFAYLQDYVNGQ